MAEKEVDDFLAHHGIRGMKWGVRRSENQLARAREGIDKANSFEKDKIYVSGKGRRARVRSGEAARAEALRAIAKKHGPNTLSNADLQFLNQRLQLNASYTKFNPKEKNKIVQVISAVNKLDKASNRVASKMVVSMLDAKTGGQISKTQQVLGLVKPPKTEKKQESQKTSQPQNINITIEKGSKSKKSPKSVIETVSSKPREFYDAETGKWVKR